MKRPVPETSIGAKKPPRRSPPPLRYATQLRSSTSATSSTAIGPHLGLQSGHAPVTRNQVELMKVDTIASPSLPGFTDLGISPRQMEAVLQRMLRSN
jgi:hypothetical protein